ncbi:hypothetical protein VNO78_08593 [Psophocarpus tetragonolobus]|uniref:Uncharacterized protein n=1 Tax=Psophocarpus tetragonolobus TaxID=3891 RepID=A0AAN9XSR3_PSOTE
MEKGREVSSTSRETMERKRKQRDKEDEAVTLPLRVTTNSERVSGASGVKSNRPSTIRGEARFEKEDEYLGFQNACGSNGGFLAAREKIDKKH